jgi:hypothetical protein
VEVLFQARPAFPERQRTIAIAGFWNECETGPNGSGSVRRAESVGTARPRRVRVGIVAIPEAGVGTFSGIFDVLGGLALLAGREGVSAHPPFQVEILGDTADPCALRAGSRCRCMASSAVRATW